MELLYEVFYQPTANTLFFLMDVVGTNSIAIGILLMVVAAKLILIPVSVKSSHMQKKLSEISGELKNIKETVKDKKEQMEKTLGLYKKSGVNPFSPLLFLLIQIPFFITMFFVARDVGKGIFDGERALYSFVTQPEYIDFSFAFTNLTENAGIALAVGIIASQILLSHMSQKRGVEGVKNNKIITFFLPVVIGVLSLTIVATVGMYWFLNNIISILQEVIIQNIEKKKKHSISTEEGETTPQIAS